MRETLLCVLPSVHIEFLSAGRLAVPPSFGPSISDLLRTTSPGSFPLLYPSQCCQLKIGLVSILDLLKSTTSQNKTLIRYTEMTMTLTVRTERGKGGEKNATTPSFQQRGFVLSTLYISVFFFFFNILMFIYSWERQTECEEGRGRERGRQNRKQAPGSELSAQILTQGLNSRAVRSWPEPKSDA